MQDSKILHFLKEFPAWLVLTAIFALILIAYLKTGDQFLQRVVDTVLGGLLTLLYARSKPSVNAENINTDSVNLTPPDDPASK